MIPSSDLKKITVNDYLGVIRARKWLVLVCVLISIVLSLYAKMNPQLQYVATAVIWVKEHPVMELVKGKGVTISDQEADEKRSVDVITEKMSSYVFAEQVSQRLGGKSPGQILGMISIQTENPWRRQVSNIMKITASGRTSTEVAEVANAYVNELLESDVRSRKDTAEYGAVWIKENREDILRELQAAEGKMVEFRKEYGRIAEQADLLEELNARIENIDRRIVSLSVRYMDKHPDIVALRKEREVLVQKIKELEQVKSIPEDKLFEYKILQQETVNLRKAFDRFSSAAGEVDIAKSLILPGVQVIDWAEPPMSPKPVDKDLPVKILIVGIILSVALCFLLEYLDTSLKTPEEVEFYSEMSFLGRIDHIKTKDETEDISIITEMKQTSSASQEFRNIRVSLLFASTLEGSPDSIVVTSAAKGEGKSFVASNLAIAFAHSHDATLLIDADMRRGELHKGYKLDAGKGLSDFLKGEVALDEVVRATFIPNLDVLPSGSLLTSPTSVMTTEKIGELIKELRGRYKRIIIDVPSLTRYSDLLLWEENVKGVLFVINSGITHLAKINVAKKKIKTVPIFGAVLNDAGHLGISGIVQRLKGWNKDK